jgi:hypothetical protein
MDFIEKHHTMDITSALESNIGLIICQWIFLQHNLNAPRTGTGGYTNNETFEVVSEGQPGYEKVKGLKFNFDH